MYPSLDQVEAASHEQLLRWNRFLPSPSTPPQVAALNLIVERLRIQQQIDPTEHARASKAIGW